MQRGIQKKPSRTLHDEELGREDLNRPFNQPHPRQQSYVAQSDRDGGGPSRPEQRSRLAASLNDHSSSNNMVYDNPSDRNFKRTSNWNSSRLPSNENDSLADISQDYISEDDDDYEPDDDELNSNLVNSIEEEEDEFDNDYAASLPVKSKSPRAHHSYNDPSLHDSKGKKIKSKKSSSTKEKSNKMPSSSFQKKSSSHGKVGKHGSDSSKTMIAKYDDNDVRNGNTSGGGGGKKSSRERVQFGNRSDNGESAHRSSSGLSHSHSNSGSRMLSHGQPQMRPASNAYSREVMALPLEIPESVPDMTAFRQYLSRSESSRVGLGPAFSKTLNTSDLAAHRRTMALSHAIMTLALLSASASQLRFVVAYAHAHSYPALNYFLICTCIFIEILAGIGYVVLSRFDFTENFVEKLHSYLIFGLFIVAVSNVIIAAFALDDHVCEMIAKKAEQYDSVEQPMEPSPK